MKLSEYLPDVPQMTQQMTDLNNQINMFQMMKASSETGEAPTIGLVFSYISFENIALVKVLSSFIFSIIFILALACCVGWFIKWGIKNSSSKVFSSLTCVVIWEVNSLYFLLLAECFLRSFLNAVMLLLIASLACKCSWMDVVSSGTELAKSEPSLPWTKLWVAFSRLSISSNDNSFKIILPSSSNSTSPPNVFTFSWTCGLTDCNPLEEDVAVFSTDSSRKGSILSVTGSVGYLPLNHIFKP